MLLSENFHITFYLGNDDDDKSCNTSEVEEKEYFVFMIVHCFNDAGGETEILVLIGK